MRRPEQPSDRLSVCRQSVVQDLGHVAAGRSAVGIEDALTLAVHESVEVGGGHIAPVGRRYVAEAGIVARGWGRQFVARRAYEDAHQLNAGCLLYTSPSPRD